MGIIKVKDLVYEYIRRDEEGNVESITKALDGVSMEIKKGGFLLRFSVIMARENPLWPST